MTRLLSKGRLLARSLTVIVSLFVFLAASSAQAAPQYTTVQDLGSLGGNQTGVEAVNAAGHAVGGATDSAGAAHGFLFNGSSIAQACTLVNATDINDSDLIVGGLMVKGSHGSNVERPATCQGSTVKNLGTLGGTDTSEALGVSDAGQVVGFASSKVGSPGYKHAFLYSGGKMTDLGTLPNGLESTATAVNSQGTVVGYAALPGQFPPVHAFSWTPLLGMQDLGTLPGYTNSDAVDINDKGTIVGTSCNLGADEECTLGTADGHAWMIEGGAMFDLGTLPGDVRSEAVAVNDFNQVVGRSYDASGHAHPFLYTDGTMYNLNQLSSGGAPPYPTDISDSEQVVAESIDNLPYTSALLSPSLLSRWAPELVYDSQEGYRADSAAEITDNYQPGQYTNTLYDSNNVALAAADPADPSDQLSLSYLTTPNYPSGVAAQSGDHIDEANSYAVDENRLHALPQYADKTYGRVVPEPGGQYELQYWFFEYLNSKTFVGVGQHEGDWEMIQVHLGSSGTPIGAAYAQHKGGEVCPWGNVQTTADGRPIVYVAQGSHASYYNPGTHDLAIWGLFGFSDTNDGGGGNPANTVNPTVIDVTSPPQWIKSWPGLWGGSMGTDSSPQSPGQQGQKWDDPLGWEVAQGSNCQAPPAGARHATGKRSGSAVIRSSNNPPLPKFHATIVGTRVRITYHFKSFPKSRTRRPWQLITSVVSANPKYAPLTAQTQLRGRRSGRLSQSLGLGRGPYRLLLSVRSALGTRSRTVNVALH